MPCRVVVDKQSCQSSGRCLQEAPGAFFFDDDRLAEAGPKALLLDRERLMAIARACPAIAISLFDEAGVEIEF